MSITTGKISKVQDCGTVVIVSVRSDNGSETGINFDRNAFRWLLEGEDIKPNQLIDRAIEFDGDFIKFLET